MKRPPQDRGLETIDLVRLDTVTGGRIIPRKGTDPTLLAGLTELTKIIQTLGQQMNAKKEAGNKEMLGMVQQLMQQRAGKK